MNESETPWTLQPDGSLRLRVRLTPKSSQDLIEGVCPTPSGAAVQARVRAVPENGAANTALTRLVADWLKLPRSSVELTSGGKSRIKTLTLMPDDVSRLRGQLEAWAATGKEKK